MPSPLARYNHALEHLGFHSDEAQRQAVMALQNCYAELHASPARAPLGVYLWGPVGRGKTWLMDQFQQCLEVPSRRQHFHHFMQWVHRRLFELSGTPAPLQALAAGLADEVRVLCFDELFVNDIGDAIILGGLFQALFSHNVVLVATSNQPPDQLYADGFNRERFLPAIAALNANMQVVAVAGEQDHRQHPGRAHTRYWVRAAGQASVMGEQFQQLSAGQSVSSAPVSLEHRSIAVVRHSPSVLWCRFADLCLQPLAASDYIALCDRFQALLISDVPRLGSPPRPSRIARGTEDGVERVVAGDRVLPALSVHDDAVRRFIALVDECYDRHVPLYLEAEVELTALYTEGALTFAFRRTLSRLQEMQLERFVTRDLPTAR